MLYFCCSGPRFCSVQSVIVIVVVWKIFWKGWQSYVDAKLRKLVEDCTDEIEKTFTRQRNQQRPVGLAIVIRTVVSPPLGTDEDVENMKNAFESLQFAVMKKDIAHLDDFRAIVKAAAEYLYIVEEPSCKVIAVYYAGHGDSKGGRPVVVIRDGEEHFVEDIVSPFYPMNAPNLKNIKRLFFFDMCLGDQVDAGSRKFVKAKPLLPFLKHAVPAKGNCLVAYANSVGFESRGSKDGGFWTRHLYKNITDDMEIHEVLAKTHDDTVNDRDLQLRVQDKNIQGPFWTTCMGRLNLKRLNGIGEQELLPTHPSRSQPQSAHTRRLPATITAREVETDNDDIDHLRNKEPELVDLVNWLHDIAYLWYQLGERLKVPKGTLKAIDQSLRGQVDRKLSEVLNKWEESVTSPHTFGNLFESLEKIKQGKYANMLKQRLRNPVVYAKYDSEPDFDFTLIHP